MKNTTKKWIRSGLEILIHGGAAAMGSGLSAAVVGKGVSFELFSAQSWKLMLSAFLINGGVRFMQWWANNPLPPEGDSTVVDAKGTPLIPTPTISLNPLSKVQTLTKAP